MKKFLIILFSCLTFTQVQSQDCLGDYTINVNTQPVDGTYECGQTITICLDIQTWNTTNSNWIHGVIANFGPGWDLATLSPGPPPTTVGTSGGLWGWYNLCTSTSGVGLPPQGPGFFFDLDNDGDPGNNFGDLSLIGPWQFCWTISVLSDPDCINGADLSISFDIFGDSETGSWGALGCSDDPTPTFVAQVMECPSAGTGTSLTLCNTSASVDLFPLLTDDPSVGGVWTDPDGNIFNGIVDPSTSSTGPYTYTIPAGLNCDESSSISSLTINQQSIPGESTEVIMCSDGPNYELSNSLELLNPPIDPTIGSWTDPLGNPSSGVFDPSSSMNGQYNYTIVGSAPCQNAVTSVEVYAYSLPESEADFVQSPFTNITMEDTKVSFFAMSDHETYQWQIGTETLYGHDITFEFPDDNAAQYTVCLTAGDTLGCEATTCKTVTINESFSLHTPNAFTPNGDGVNDVFIPVIMGEDVDITEFRIFDRWGGVVYEASGEILPWNGSKNNEGSKLPQGLYTWTLLTKHAFVPDREENKGHVVMMY